MDNPLLVQEKLPPIEIRDATLNDEQKSKVLKLWEESNPPPPVSELVKIAWPNATREMLDGRYMWAKSIKSFLTDDHKINVPPVVIEIERIKELTEEQQEYVRNHCRTMKAHEMARELFSDPSITPVSMQSVVIREYMKNLGPAILFGDDAPDAVYNPPKQIRHVVARIKRCVNVTKSWHDERLTPTQKKNCDMLMHYLHDLRFRRQIDSYEKTEDKITFESEFIKYTYNKPELEQEEISQYVALCSFVVQEFNIKGHIEMLQRNIEREYDENDGKISGNLIEALESARADLGSCTLRQGKLYESLTEKRSEKMSKELKDKESLLNFFNTWKNHDSRQQLLKIRQKDKENLRKQIQEIEEMSELKQRILGISIDEIIDG